MVIGMNVLIGACSFGLKIRGKMVSVGHPQKQHQVIQPDAAQPRGQSNLRKYGTDLQRMDLHWVDSQHSQTQQLINSTDIESATLTITQTRYDIGGGGGASIQMRTAKIASASPGHCVRMEVV
jgi:hypothetical protein